MTTRSKTVIRKISTVWKLFFNDNRGVSLIDSVIALGLLLIVLTGSVGLYTSSLRRTGETKYLGVATYAARLHLEGIKDTAFDYIPAYYPENIAVPIQTPSLPAGSSLTVSYPNGSLANPLVVAVTASWSEDGQMKTVQLSTKLTEMN